MKRKPKPLCTEFKTLADAKTGVMIALDICEGAEAMQKKDLSKELGITAATTLRLVEEGKQHTECHSQDEDTRPKNIFFGDSWFGSVKVAAQVKKRGGALLYECKDEYKTLTKKMD